MAYAAPETTAKLDLNQVFKEVERNNPELAGLRSRAEATSFDVTAEPILPPPVFEVNSMGSQGPFVGDGHMETSYRIKQELIFPTKFLARKDALSHMSEGAAYSRDARLLELRAEAKKAYVDYWASGARISLIEQRSEIILAHSRRLKSAPLSTKLQQAHIVAAETDHDLAQAELEEVRQGLAVARGTLNTLMGKDPNGELAQASEPPISELPPVPRADESQALIARHPKVLSLSSEVLVQESMRSAARSEYFPNLMVEYWNNRRFDNTPNTSELMVGVSVPFLYFWQPRAMAQAAGARVVEKEAQLTQAKNEFKLRLLKEYATLASLRAQSLAYEKKILPGAAKRLKISHSLAPTDMESLTEHRESMESEVNLRLKALEIRSNYEKSFADYEALVGGGGKQ